MELICQTQIYCMNYQHILARVTAPVYYFNIVLYGETAVKWEEADQLKQFLLTWMKGVLNHYYVKL